MNGRLFDFPEERVPGTRGRRAKKGKRLISFKEMLNMNDLGWVESSIMGYGGAQKKIRYLTNTSLWGVDGVEAVPIKWVLVVDPEGKLDPFPLMSTDVDLTAEKIISLYIDRWGIEVTFEEVREHLGVETQRQWYRAYHPRSDGALYTSVADGKSDERSQGHRT